MDETVVVIGAVAAIVTSVTGLVAALGVLLNKVRELRSQLKKKMKIVGIVSGSSVPPSLERTPEYTDIKDAIDSGHPQAIVYCRTLSYALRHCDFVVYKGGTDPKIHDPDDKFWETLV